MKTCLLSLFLLLVSCQKAENSGENADFTLKLDLILPLEVSRSPYRMEFLKSQASHILVTLETAEGKKRDFVFPPDRWSDIWVGLSDLEKSTKGKLWISVDLISAEPKPVVLFKGRKGALIEEIFQKDSKVVTLPLHAQLPLNEIFKL
jgi:hypothetical protein